MKRKVSRVALGAMLFALYTTADAQLQPKIVKIGELVFRSRPDLGPAREVFRRELHNLGYVEGKNITFETRSAGGKLDRFPVLADELVRLKVDVLVATSTTEALAFKNTTKTIPIVFIVGSDPVTDGLVDSLARPGGNVTGFTNLHVEMAGKRLELLKETVPKARRIGLLYDPTNRGNLIAVEEVQAAARLLGLTIRSWELRAEDGFEKVFPAISKDRLDGLFVPGGPLMNGNEKRIAAFAFKNRLPSVYQRSTAVDAGGLMSYGPDTPDQFRRAARYVDKILKGTKPTDLPVEQPMKFEFVINLKTAKQIGLTIPPNVLVRADRVIK